MPRPQFFYRSAPQTDVRPSSVGRRKFLLPKDAPDYLKAYAFDVEFECVLDSVFPPAPKNTPSNNATFNLVAGYSQVDANAILTDYSQPADSGAGLGKFTGTFNIIPAPWDEFTTANVTFPGWIDGPAASDARPALTRNVTIRTRYDYFLIDPANLAAAVLDSAGNVISTVASKSLIPQLTRGMWLNTHLVSGVRVPIPNSEVPDLVPAGGAAVGASVYVETAPTLDNYKLWCAVAVTFKASGAAWDAATPPPWDGAGTAATYGQYIFQDSVLSIYAGNIIERATSFALFQ